MFIKIMREGLPAEIVEYIISFICDRRGYNIFNYNRRKRINEPRMERIISEIEYFNQRSYSISWLKPSAKQRRRTSMFKKSLKDGRPSIVYHIGCFYEDQINHQDKKELPEKRALKALYLYRNQ